MGIFDFFKKSKEVKSPLEKFEEIKSSVQTKMAWMMSGDLSGMSAEDAALKAMYQALDKELGKQIGDEVNKQIDELNEAQQVLRALKEEVVGGRMTEAELDAVMDSKEFKGYMSSVTSRPFVKSKDT